MPTTYRLKGIQHTYGNLTMIRLLRAYNLSTERYSAQAGGDAREKLIIVPTTYRLKGIQHGAGLVLRPKQYGAYNLSTERYSALAAEKWPTVSNW